MVDITAGHELLSFIDAYSEYNQIPMFGPDEEHSSFITDRGLYYYKESSHTIQTKPDENLILYLAMLEVVVSLVLVREEAQLQLPIYDVNDEIEIENFPGLNDDWVEELNEIVPKVEMKSKELNEVFEFYKNYASCVGFPVRKHNSKKGDDGVVRNVTFTCSREGRGTSNTSTSLKPQPTIQTRCNAMVTVVSDASRSWRLTKVQLEHNHKISPSKSRCRVENKKFGDAVTFDSTYLTNRYDMPFAPFVGVNYHGQSTLLGCGLISNEDTQTFTWLFRTWLECMEGKAPIGITTDQDRAITPAQLRYDELCETLRKVADVEADDEEHCREITDWLEMKMINLKISNNKSSCGSNLISGHSLVQATTEREIVDKDYSVHMLDPKFSKTKGAPKKLRKKGPLVIGSTKKKAIARKRPKRSPRPDHPGHFS
ncbi:Protein FAR1-RELATED SEQUENCE [Abeliophyllum distichum]|uniref:Protein FAR1-RELATED SEQUENCE n=1 Tax=Abeliophyllum distichum TaxID=126358 RepID=A0ABD1PTU3_9LAMI